MALLEQDVAVTTKRGRMCQVYAAAASEPVWTMLFELWDRNLK